MAKCVKYKRVSKIILFPVFKAQHRYHYRANWRIRLTAIMLNLIWGYFSAWTQTTENLPHSVEQQLENNTANNQDIPPDDDNYLQSLQYYIQYPININGEDLEGLQELHLISALQIEQLKTYRKFFGLFLSIYELQSVPFWDVATLEKVRPYLTVSLPEAGFTSLKNRFRNGGHSLLLRLAQIGERSKGYLINDSAGSNHYTGPPQKIFIRYTFLFRHLLQLGMLGDKDAGEPFFGGKSKKGFDFYSFHFFARNLGIISAIALGDFTVSMGQGLTEWQTTAFKKSGAVMGIKREGAVLNPYHSAGEVNFHRGFGITLAKKAWQATLFGSFKRIDAHLVFDSTLKPGGFVSSLQTSGYHRTASEIADKGIEPELSYGGNISRQFNKLHLGINAVRYSFKIPFKKTDDPYNKYSLRGRDFGNYGIDYSFTWRNFHLFGEMAIDENLDKAIVAGSLIGVSSKASVSLLYRNISPGYLAINANAFTENSIPGNEKGFYTGITIKPNMFWQIDAYADFFKFPWLKYRINKPSVGSDFLVQATYRPGSHLEIYSQYHALSKYMDFNPGSLVLPISVVQPRQNWRSQLNYVLKPGLIFRGRIEMVWFDAKGYAPEQGFLSGGELFYKPPRKRFSLNSGLLYFDTDGYNSRLYTFERDVLFAFSVPVLYDRGYRYYINFHYEFNKKFMCWIKCAQSLYIGKNFVGSGLDEIIGNHRTEIKFQALYKF